MSISSSFNISSNAAMAISEAVGETSTVEMKSSKTCLLTLSKEPINTPNIYDFAAFEDLSTKLSLNCQIHCVSFAIVKALQML